jgi:hypothetical protein
MLARSETGFHLTLKCGFSTPALSEPVGLANINAVANIRLHARRGPYLRTWLWIYAIRWQSENLLQALSRLSDIRLRVFPGPALVNERLGVHDDRRGVWIAAEDFDFVGVDDDGDVRGHWFAP